jgi:creatinine amidohydrolase
MEYYWIRCTEAELAGLHKATRGVALLPVSSIESHGPHLPLGSDPLCLDHVVRRVLEREKAAVLPNLPYTFVAEARMLPGAVHIRSEVLMDFAECVLDEVSRNGFKKIVILHGHGGNIFLGDALLRRVLEREKDYAVYSIPVFAGRWEGIKALLETDDYGHACEMETSLNMVACPELVNLKVLGTKTFPSRPGPEVASAACSTNWCIRHPEMAVGVPQKATAEKGEKIAQLWADGIVETLRKIKKDARCPKGMSDYRRKARSLVKGGRKA